MVYNTLKKIFLGSNHLLTITMATMMHPFQNAEMDNNSMKVFFVLKNIKKIWPNKKLKFKNDTYMLLC